MIHLSDSSVFIPHAQMLVDFGGGESFNAPDRPVSVLGASISPWGADNDQPQKVLSMIEKNDVVGSNVSFNVNAAYGQGIIPMLQQPDGKLLPCDNEEVNLFFENNDINGFFLEQINDLVTFNNVFPQLILNGKGDKIVQLSHLEAAFSRWGSITSAAKGIDKHYYYHGWGSSTPKVGEMSVTDVLAPGFAYDRLVEMAAQRKRRFVMRVVMPTPGRTYYARPSWWSIFESGTYELSAMIPKTKIALLKNNLSIRNVVYISNSYWSDFLAREGINTADKDKVNQAKKSECKRIADFISNSESKGGTLIATKESGPGSTGKAIEDRHIVIESLKSSVDGELIKDSEEASNIICYAMGVHPSLIGATPGKNGGSLGGSDKRELFMVKQSLMRPYRDRLLQPLNLIKRFNKWPSNLKFALPEYQFPTLDKSSSGQQTTIQSAQ